jgi:hypothetical protein
MTYKFSDEVISTIARSLQVAILTGTDVVDNLRAIRVLTNEDGEIVLTDDYRNAERDNIDRMLQVAQEMQEAPTDSTEAN